MSVESARTRRFARLSSLDRMFLHLEAPDWPGHFGGLAVAEGKALLDGAGQLRLQEIRERVHRRLAHVPQLRRRLHVPGPLGGGALWVDDQRFDIRHHVHQTAVEAPGGDLQLLDAAARLYGQLVCPYSQASRPLTGPYQPDGHLDLTCVDRTRHGVPDDEHESPKQPPCSLPGRPPWVKIGLVAR